MIELLKDSDWTKFYNKQKVVYSELSKESKVGQTTLRKYAHGHIPNLKIMLKVVKALGYKLVLIKE